MFYCKFAREAVSERILRTGHDLTEIPCRIWCLPFNETRCTTACNCTTVMIYSTGNLGSLVVEVSLAALITAVSNGHDSCQRRQHLRLYRPIVHTLAVDRQQAGWQARVGLETERQHRDDHGVAVVADAQPGLQRHHHLKHTCIKHTVSESYPRAADSAPSPVLPPGGPPWPQCYSHTYDQRCNREHFLARQRQAKIMVFLFHQEAQMY